MSTTTVRFGLLSLLIIAGFLFAVVPAFANHPSEEEEESHATTVDDSHHEEVITTSVGGSTDIERMQALILVLQQLIDLLQHQLEHASDDSGAVETETEVEHGDEEEHEDEADHEDNDDDHDEDAE